KLGSNITGWQYGKIHTMTYNHPLGMIKPLEKIFNRGPYPSGGDIDTVNNESLDASPAREGDRGTVIPPDCEPGRYESFALGTRSGAVRPGWQQALCGLHQTLAEGGTPSHAF